jgi:hypothetical protein
MAFCNFKTLPSGCKDASPPALGALARGAAELLLLLLLPPKALPPLPGSPLPEPKFSARSPPCRARLASPGGKPATIINLHGIYTNFMCSQSSIGN